ncbi:LONRF1 [Symbiodinium natans]|uniref:LONRF1 protein n=1 Tax=Symbiodinium natans TaxID=878477 RepID=A0A812PDU5_9DINO|nr:LONRF1 [Symbiodinium natans]
MSADEDFVCALCHELIYEPVVLPCSHAFCRACLVDCLHRGPSARRCPLCRKLLHATAKEDLVPCAAFGSLLAERFPEEYARRGAAEKAVAEPESEGSPPDSQEELPLFVLESILPLQRLHLNVFEPRYRALVRVALQSGRRFGLVGFDGNGSHLKHGVEAVIEACEQTADGRFQLQIVATRAFKIMEASLHESGYLLATVRFPCLEKAPDSEEVQTAEALLPDLEEWQGFVRAERPHHLDGILRQLGPRPPCTQPGAMALWAAALLNPLPPLGVAPELRADVLAAETAAARLQVVKRGLSASLEHLRLLANSPARRWVLMFSRLPAPVALTAVVVVACIVSAAFPGQARG